MKKIEIRKYFKWGEFNYDGKFNVKMFRFY